MRARQVRANMHLRATGGERGEGKARHGRGAQDLVIKVRGPPPPRHAAARQPNVGRTRRARLPEADAPEADAHFCSVAGTLPALPCALPAASLVCWSRRRESIRGVPAHADRAVGYPRSPHARVRARTRVASARAHHTEYAAWCGRVEARSRA